MVLIVSKAGLRATRIPLIKTHSSLVYYISCGLTLALTRLLPRTSEGYALQCTRIPPQVAQARNMNIGEYRHCCVTFRIKGFVWEKNLSFL